LYCFLSTAAFRNVLGVTQRNAPTVCGSWKLSVRTVLFKSSLKPQSGWTTGRSRGDPRQKGKDFPAASASRPALGPTQPPVQLVPGVLSPGVKRSRGVTLTTHPHLVPRSRMSRSYISSPQAPSWRVVGLL
jgi:hypothetical protein